MDAPHGLSLSFSLLTFTARHTPKNENNPNTTTDPVGGTQNPTVDEKIIPENAGAAALAIDPPNMARPCVDPLCSGGTVLLVAIVMAETSVTEKVSTKAYTELSSNNDDRAKVPSGTPRLVTNDNGIRTQNGTPREDPMVMVL